MDEKTSNVLYFTLLRDLHALAFTTLLMQYRHAALLDLAIHGSTKHRELLRNRNRIQIIERCRDLIAPEPLGKKSSCAVLPRYQSTSYRKRHHFSQLFLCLSRACLGKMMIFNTRIEWRNKEGVFRTSSESPHAWRAILISSSSGGQPCDRQHALTQLIVLSGECVSQLVDSFIGVVLTDASRWALSG